MSTAGNTLIGTAMPGSSKSHRDLRIDLARGIALLIIFSDHVHGNVVSLFTPIRFGLSDMAEVFVFLSGYVCCLAYSRVLNRSGFWACQRKAIKRCVQLYVAHIATVLAMFGVLWVANRNSPEAHVLAGFGEFSGVLADPAAATREVLLLKSTPGNFEILPLYAIFLAALPAMLWLARRHALLMLAPSLALYCLVQCFPSVLVLPGAWQTAWLFNPWAWQFLFFLGVFFASVTTQRLLSSRDMRALSFLAFVVVEAIFLWKVFDPSANIPWSGKGDLQPSRPIHFLCLVILGRVLLPTTQTLQSQRWLTPLLACGQNSLLTYCLGAILSTAGSLLLAAAGTSVAFHVTVNVAGWTICGAVTLFANIMTKRRSGGEPATGRPA